MARLKLNRQHSKKLRRKLKGSSVAVTTQQDTQQSDAELVKQVASGESQVGTKNVMALQRTVGNRAVQRMISRDTPTDSVDLSPAKQTLHKTNHTENAAVEDTPIQAPIEAAPVQRSDTVQRGLFDFFKKKKKEPEISGPTAGHKMTPEEQGSAPSMSQLISWNDLQGKTLSELQTIIDNPDTQQLDIPFFVQDWVDDIKTFLKNPVNRIGCGSFKIKDIIDLLGPASMKQVLKNLGTYSIGVLLGLPTATDPAAAFALAEEATWLTQKDKTLTEFNKYNTDNPNSWTKDIYKKLAAFAALDHNLVVFGTTKIGDIHAKVTADADALDHLESDSLAVNKQEPISLTPAPNLDDSIKRGKALHKLKTNFPLHVLRTALNQAELDLFIKHNAIDSVIDYYKNTSPQPIFQAENGKDFRSYLLMKVNEGIDPKSYATGALSGWVRNYHRFERNALDKLKTNVGDTSKAKPLTLILHSTLDHNGAFHRDPKLTEAISSPKNHTLMIEGKSTLNEVESEIEPLAKKYGKNNKLDQVMIAGHGSSQSIQLTGYVGEYTSGPNTGKLGEGINNEDRVNLVTNKARTQQFFDTIIANMAKDGDLPEGADPASLGHRRVLFNACLTNSNFVRATLDNDVPKAQQGIKDYIKNNPSLATFFQQRAKEKGAGGIKSMGANASIGQVGLIDTGSGALDLVSGYDPSVTASKLEYVEKGKEPHGAMISVIESWAHDRTATAAAMDRRIAQPVTTWRDAVIKAVYTLARAKWDNAEYIRGTLTDFAEQLSSAEREKECRVSILAPKLEKIKADFSKDAAINVIKTLQTSPTWTDDSKKYVPLVFYQIWMALDDSEATVQTNFMTHLSAKFDLQSAWEMVDIKYLGDKNLLSKLLVGAATTGKLMLAVLGVIGTATHNDCRAYLRAQLDKDDKGALKSPLVFKTGVDIKPFLAGKTTEQKVLDAIK